MITLGTTDKTGVALDLSTTKVVHRGCGMKMCVGGWGLNDTAGVLSPILMRKCKSNEVTVAVTPLKQLKEIENS